MELAFPNFPVDPLGVVVYVIGLIVLWIVISVPVYFAGRAVKGRTASFGDALGATLGGVIVYYIVFFVVAFFLGAVIGVTGADVFALFLGLIAWLAVFRAAFDTGWLGAIGIVVIAWLILLVLDFFLVAAFGVKFPDFFPF
jgi:hypothetical protein